MGVGWSLVFWSGNPMDAQRYLGAAVAQMTLIYSPTWESVLGGVLGSFLMGVITLSFVSRRQQKITDRIIAIG